MEVTDLSSWLISRMPKVFQWIIAGYILLNTVLFIVWALVEGIPNIIREVARDLRLRRASRSQLRVKE